MADLFPKRIVCMTEETTEMLYLLDEQHRIVGISGFTVRPAIARKEKPKVSAFTSADIDKIVDLQPDLVLGFSDIQADIAASLIRLGINVHIFNQRSIQEILEMIVLLGAMVGVRKKAEQWIEEFELKRTELIVQIPTKRKRPKVYFEEWFDPIITGIQWVSEIIELAGGEDCYPEHAKQSLAKNRIVADPAEVIKKQPDIILVSWCGKKFKPKKMLSRPGWEHIPAVINNNIFEIKSDIILQPGPAALTDGLDEVKSIIEKWHEVYS